MSRLPRPTQDLGWFLREQRRLQRQQASASSFSRSGLNVTGPGEIASDDFDGDIPNRNAGTQGWGASGGTLAAGDLLLRPRSIGDDSLSSLVTPDLIYKATSGFALTKAGADVAADAITVPEGYTSAVVTATARVFGYNNTAAVDYLNAQLHIDQYGGQSIPSVATANGGSATNEPPLSVVLYDLTAGQQIPFGVFAWSGFANWATNSGNVAEISGSIIWFR